MNQATIRALSQVGELVKEEKHDPRQKFIREKDAALCQHSLQFLLRSFPSLTAGIYRVLHGVTCHSI